MTTNSDARPPLDTAMVFAAGLGTRMRPITDRIPKPLVTIGGKTMLDHMLDRLADGGVSRAIVNVHHLPDQIETHLQPRKRPEIIISDRGIRWGLAGGVALRSIADLKSPPDPIVSQERPDTSVKVLRYGKYLGLRSN